jgi:hypothetical protein
VLTESVLTEFLLTGVETDGSLENLTDMLFYCENTLVSNTHNAPSAS